MAELKAHTEMLSSHPKVKIFIEGYVLQMIIEMSFTEDLQPKANEMKLRCSRYSQVAISPILC